MLAALTVAILPSVVANSGIRWAECDRAKIAEPYHTRTVFAQCALSALYHGHLDEAVFYWSAYACHQTEQFPDYNYNASYGGWTFEATYNNCLNTHIKVSHEGTNTVLGSTESAVYEVGDIFIDYSANTGPWLKQYDHDTTIDRKFFLEWLDERGFIV